MRTIFSIEGNIGSGKSTLLSLIRKNLQNVQVVPQPVADWQNISKFNLLDQYYQEPHRWAYTFQTNAIVSRMTGLKKLLEQMQNKPNHTFFSERSIIADKQIFAKMLHRQQKMNDLEHELYLRMFCSLDNLFKNPKQHKFIYLKTKPEKCMERVEKRSREEQKNIPLQYLKQINDLHDEWLVGSRASLIVDGDIEFEKCDQRTQQILRNIKQFIGQ